MQDLSGAQAAMDIVGDIADAVQILRRQVGFWDREAVGVFEEEHQLEYPCLVEDTVFQQRRVLAKIEHIAIVEEVRTDEFDDLLFDEVQAQRAGDVVCHPHLLLRHGAYRRYCREMAILPAERHTARPRLCIAIVTLPQSIPGPAFAPSPTDPQWPGMETLSPMVD